MRTNSPSIGLGIVIGVTLGAALLLATVFVNSVAPQANALRIAPEAAATSLPVLPPTQVAAPSPTATYTPIASSSLRTNLAPALDLSASPTSNPIIAVIVSGKLSFSGPLPAPQQITLYRASLSYARTGASESKRVAKEINGVGYGDPSNICGPLALAILRDAGVVAADIDPHDFWLLDPSKVPDQRLLAAAFPDANFAHQKVVTPLNQVDWTKEPLQPGDFLFIWHGSWGNFDHMLVVNRVDSEGRAYAVTNFGTPQGYVIAETMLYDPIDPKAGIFYTWTKERDALLGSTGFGGFELWRARAP